MNQAQEVPVGEREASEAFIRRERGRLGQGAIFAIILICFFLPFLNTSCADQELADDLRIKGDADEQRFTGFPKPNKAPQNSALISDSKRPKNISGRLSVPRLYVLMPFLGSCTAQQHLK